MPWGRIEAGMHEHPKFDGLSDAAVRTWLNALSWSCLHLTDGRLPATLPLSITRARKPREINAIVGELTRAPLWDPLPEGGWRIRNWERYQLTKAQVQRDRDASAERKRRWRERRGHEDGTAEERRPERRDIAVRNGVGNGSPSHPIPSHPKEEKEDVELERSFALFWDAYPRRDGKKLGKDRTYRKWRRMTPSDREAALRGVKNYAEAVDLGLTLAMDPFRWLGAEGTRVGEQWGDWQEPATPGGRRVNDDEEWKRARERLIGGTA